jgi:hypothetical protein
MFLQQAVDSTSWRTCSPWPAPQAAYLHSCQQCTPQQYSCLQYTHQQYSL